MKFKFNAKIADSSFDFPNVESTDTSPLAAKIFGFPWVSSVFIGHDFMTITKQDWVDWSVIAQPLTGLLSEHILSGLPVFIESILAENSIEAVVKSSSSVVIVASKVSNFPDTLVNIRCFTLKPTSECVGSIVHLVVDIIVYFIFIVSIC